MIEKIKIAFAQPKWYLQPCLICLCFLLWFLIIPFIVGITLLVFYYIDSYSRNLKYGEFDKIDEKIKELNKNYTNRIANEEKKIKEKLNELNKNLKEKEEELLNKIKATEAKTSNLLKNIGELETEKENLENELSRLNSTLIIEYGNIQDYSNITSQEIKNQLSMLKLEQDSLVKENQAIIIIKTQTMLDKRTFNSNIKQIFRSFNNECNLIINSLTIKNIDTARNNMAKSFIALNKLYESDFVFPNKIKWVILKKL